MSTFELLFSFKGRIDRGTYWVVQACCFALLLLISGSSKAAGGDGGPVAAVFLLGFVWVQLSSQVKRWHDIDHSAWSVLLHFIPIVGSLYCFVALGFFGGTEGANRFGTGPLRSVLGSTK